MTFLGHTADGIFATPARWRLSPAGEARSLLDATAELDPTADHGASRSIPRKSPRQLAQPAVRRAVLRRLKQPSAGATRSPAEGPADAGCMITAMRGGGGGPRAERARGRAGPEVKRRRDHVSPLDCLMMDRRQAHPLEHASGALLAHRACQSRGRYADLRIPT